MCGKRNRKVWGIGIAAMVAALAMLSVGGPAWAAAIIDVADLVVDNTGDSVTSPIMVNDVVNLASGTILIDYDSSVVNVTDVTTDLFPMMFDWGTETQSGTIVRLTVLGMNTSGGQTGNVVFANVTYEAVGSPGDSCVLDLIRNDDLMDYDYAAIPHTLSDGSFTIGSVPPPITLDLVDNGCPDTGLHSYTLRATGVGITTLSKFTIDGEVHQVFDNGTPSEWLGDESASELEITDSHVIFGELRMPDLGGDSWPGPGEQPEKFTLEEIIGGGDVGMGTLNNHHVSTDSSDAYLKLGEPSTEEETVELMQLVVEDGKGFSVDLKLLTSIDSVVTTHDDLSFTLAPLTPGDANGDGYVDSTDVSILAQHWLQESSTICWADGDFNRDGAVDDTDATILAANWNPPLASVPEPSTLVLLASLAVAGGVVLRRRRA